MSPPGREAAIGALRPPRARAILTYYRTTDPERPFMAHTLPPLPYDIAALEPRGDEAIQQEHARAAADRECARPALDHRPSRGALAREREPATDPPRDLAVRADQLGVVIGDVGPEDRDPEHRRPLALRDRGAGVRQDEHDGGQACGAHR